MDLDATSTAIEKAVSAYVDEIQLPGIVDAAVCKVAVPSEQLQQVSAQLEQHGHSEVTVSAEVQLFLRFSNTKALPSIDSVEFRVSVDADADNLHAVASTENDWAAAWERGIGRVKQRALQAMKDALREMDLKVSATAMVLLTSSMVGPYTDRITTFLGYPVDFVQEIAARLIDAKIWRVTKSTLNRGTSRNMGQCHSSRVS